MCNHLQKDLMKSLKMVHELNDLFLCAVLML